MHSFAETLLVRATISKLPPKSVEQREPNWRDAAIVAAFCALMAVQCLPVYNALNATFDEGYHLAAGLQAVQRFDFVIGVEQPPLARWLTGLLPTLAGVEFREVEIDSDGIVTLKRLSEMTLEGQGSYWRTLTLARLATLPFIPLLLVYAMKWSWELGGRAAAVTAGLFTVFSPNLLAHASITTVDFAAASTLLPAAYYLSRWLSEGGRRAAAIAGGFTGLACMTKYSALPYLTAILVGYGLAAYLGGRRRPAWSLGNWAKQLALFVAVALLVCWACFGFRLDTLTDSSRRPYETIDRIVPGSGVAHEAAYWAAETVPLPLLGMLKGVRAVAFHNQSGHRGFLLGERSMSGWPHYFVVVLLTKTTIPLLLGAALGLWVAWVGGDRRWVALLVPPLVVMAVGMTSSINVGVRHILGVYPFLAILASAAVSRVGWARWRCGAISILLAWHAIEAITASPDFIPYFNQTVRGHEQKVLGDSNLDWGQDLYRLSLFMEDRGIEQVSLHYFGTTDPATLGIRARPFGPSDEPTGWVAASVTAVQGIYDPPLTWLAQREPFAKVGKSILVYQIPTS